VLIAAVSQGALGVGALVTAFTFGLHHGIDWDHLAAITDFRAAAERPRRSLLLATAFVIGHALVVLALGILAVALAARLPPAVDSVMDRVVGATLLALGVSVFVALIRGRGRVRMRSRWMRLIGVLRRVTARIRRSAGGTTEVVVIEHDHPHDHDGPGHVHPHPLFVDRVPFHRHDHARQSASSATAVDVQHHHRHRHVLAMPDDPFTAPTGSAALGVGILHGIGAETPTQVLVLVGAAGAGAAAGPLVLAAFVVGLVLSNTLVAVAAAYGSAGSARRRSVFLGISVATGVFSLVMGGFLVAGAGDALPQLLGG
jgi:high-affinity nickel-transport protein